MPAGGLHLTVVTPDRGLVDESVEEAQVPGVNGYLGILPGHAPLFSELAIGELSYTQAGRVHSICLVKGFVEVLEDRVRVLSDAAEKASDIDLARAAAARARAEDRMTKGSGVDYARAHESLQRALARIQVAGKRGRPGAG